MHYKKEIAKLMLWQKHNDIFTLMVCLCHLTYILSLRQVKKLPAGHGQTWNSPGETVFPQWLVRAEWLFMEAGPEMLGLRRTESPRGVLSKFENSWPSHIFEVGYSLYPTQSSGCHCPPSCFAPWQLDLTDTSLHFPSLNWSQSCSKQNNHAVDTRES